MDDKILKAIDASPLSKEDKKYWKEILQKLDDEQKTRLLHSLSTKTEIKKAVDLIDETLAIIAREEKAVEAEDTQESTSKPTPKNSPNIPVNTETEKTTQQKLEQERKLSQEKLAKLRKELEHISLEAHGSPPPSYQQ